MLASLFPYTADITYFLIPFLTQVLVSLVSLSACLAAQSWLAPWVSCRSGENVWAGREAGHVHPVRGAGFLGDHGGSSSAQDAGTWISFSLTLVGLSSTHSPRGFSLDTWKSVLDFGSGFCASFRSTEPCPTELGAERELACGGVLSPMMKALLNDKTNLSSFLGELARGKL